MKQQYVKAGEIHPTSEGMDQYHIVYNADAVDTYTERLEEALRRIQQWAEAYPIDVFPEPNWPAVHELLLKNGMSLDRISASNMRHVVTGVGRIARQALNGIG